MADKKISAVPNKAVPVGTELVALADGGAPVHSSLDQIFGALGAGGIAVDEVVVDFNADPALTLPSEVSAVGGAYDSVTQTLTVDPSPAQSAAVGPFPLGTFQGAVSILDETDVIDINFSGQAIVNPNFDSTTGGSSDGVIQAVGWVPTTATAQDVLDGLAATFAGQPLPGTMPFFLFSGYVQGSLFGGGDGLISFFNDGTTSVPVVTGAFPSSVLNTKIVSNFGFDTNVSGPTLVLQTTSTYVDISTPIQQIAAIAPESAISLNTTPIKMFVMAVSANTGSGHNIASKTMLMDFLDTSYNPIALVPTGSYAVGQGGTQPDLDAVHASAVNYGSLSLATVPVGDIVKAIITVPPFDAYGTRIYNNETYRHDGSQNLFALGNSDVEGRLDALEPITDQVGNAIETFIVKPGGTGANSREFTTWDAAYNAAILVEGPVDIIIDSRLSGDTTGIRYFDPIGDPAPWMQNFGGEVTTPYLSIPAGTYDLLGNEINIYGVDYLQPGPLSFYDMDRAASVIFIETGVQFLGFQRIKGLTIKVEKTDSPAVEFPNLAQSPNNFYLEDVHFYITASNTQDFISADPGDFDCNFSGAITIIGMTGNTGRLSNDVDNIIFERCSQYISNLIVSGSSSDPFFSDNFAKVIEKTPVLGFHILKAPATQRNVREYTLDTSVGSTEFISMVGTRSGSDFQTKPWTNRDIDFTGSNVSQKNGSQNFLAQEFQEYTNTVTCQGGAGTITLTIPQFTTNPNEIPFGCVLDIINLDTGTVTIAAGAGVTLNSLGGLVSSSGQYAVMRLRNIGTDTWILSGDLA